LTQRWEKDEEARMPIYNVTLDIDDAVYQQALTRAGAEGRTLGQVLTTLLTQWAGPLPVSPPPVAAPTPAPSPLPAARTYTVQPGDTLGAIARTMYGSATKYPLIADANHITDASRIWVGQVLTIPPLPDATATPVTSPTPLPTPVVSIPTPVTEEPTPPPITWVGSPNFNSRPYPKTIWAIVVHATASGSLEGVISWFNNPAAQLSSHYTIGKDGHIVQHVRDEDRAWHAGKSEWKGVAGVNDYGLGIEMVNWNDGNDPYPEAQHQANVLLCTYLCRKHNIKPEDIVGHVDIAVPAGRKSDPRGYDMGRLRLEVTAALNA
jgi:N-acetylmuramoyl-L-alanine amidase